MNKLLFLLVLLGSVVSMSSCSKDSDENGTPVIDDQFTFDGTTYEVEDGVIIDIGAVSLISSGNATHYAYAFTVTDGSITDAPGDDLLLENSSYALQVLVFSAGTSSFSDGTFNFVDENTDLAALEGQDLFVDAVLVVDGNNDGDIDDVDAGDDREYYATGGSIEIDGSGANYALIYNLQFDNKALEGGFEGTFSIIDGDGGGTPGNNTLNIGGQEMAASSGLIVDWGSVGMHYNYDFFVTDDPNFNTNSGSILGNYLLHSKLLSAGTQEFTTGTFTYVPNNNSSNGNYFNTTTLILDTDGDGEITEADDATTATNGTITVSEDAAGLITIEYNLGFDAGLSLTGSYTGAFQYTQGAGRTSGFRVLSSHVVVKSISTK